jgi:hypothetical protein
MGALTSHKPIGLHGLLQGELCLYLFSTPEYCTSIWYNCSWKGIQFKLYLQTLRFSGLGWTCGDSKIEVNRYSTLCCKIIFEKLLLRRGNTNSCFSNILFCRTIATRKTCAFKKSLQHPLSTVGYCFCRQVVDSNFWKSVRFQVLREVTMKIIVFLRCDTM